MKKITKAEFKGIDFFDALTLLFIYLKLTGQVDWQWIWVLAPLWIPLGFAILLALFITILKKLGGKKNEKTN